MLNFGKIILVSRRVCLHQNRATPVNLNLLVSNGMITTSHRHMSTGETQSQNKESDAKIEDTSSTPPPPTQTDTEVTISNLNKEIKELKEQVLRSYAEEENVRRIARRDVDNAKIYANTSFAKSMLEVADDLERALSLVSEDQKQSGGPVLKSLVEGIEMTDKNLQKIFAKYNVVKYGSKDDVFDPTIHDALFQIPDNSKKSG